MMTDSNENSLRQELIDNALHSIDRSKAPAEAKSWIDSLLARVPTDLLKTTPSVVLAELAKRVLVAIESSARTGSAVYDCCAEHGLLISVMPDRPFIVNTVLECCRQCELSPRAVLHPVLDRKGTLFAVTVIIASPQSATELKAVEAMLKLALVELATSTDAYKAMLDLLSSSNPEVAGLDKETRAFIDWLLADGFNLFGAASSQVKLGLLHSGSHATDLWSEFKSHVSSRGSASATKNESLTVECFSSRFDAPFHRFRPLTNIIITTASGSNLFLTGLFTSRALDQECQSIPLLRQRFAEIVKHESIATNTHDAKSVANIIDSLPKEESLSLTVAQLRGIVSSVIDVGTSRETAVTVWQNEAARLVSVAAFQLADVYQPNTRNEFFDHLEKRFGNTPFIDEMHLDITNRPMVRLYARVSVKEGGLDLISLQNELESLARSWQGDLATEFRKHGISEIEELTARYYSAFSSEYQSLQNAQDCVADIQAIEKLSPSNPISVTLANFDKAEPNKATIVICSASEQITISHCVPALESFGFEVINERTWRIRPIGHNQVISTRFRVRTRSKNPINPENFESNVAPICARSLNGATAVDPLNSLHTDAALPYYAINTLRAYCRLLWQTSKSSSRFAVMRALGSTPELAAKLWQMFDIKFNPKLQFSQADRLKSFATESQLLLEALRSVSDINTDRAFRQIRILIEATVRTNLYRGGESLALKLDSQKIDFLPQPRPYFEIFVHAPAVEGCHLRAGPVARGGIRWSDRPDDYRTEVLGLMKTQRVKNSLIVPTGAKGGFIPKNLPSDPKLVPAVVLNAYTEYIRALLSITDNRINDTIVHPEGVLIYDSPDPYFVVAADKGTATFSDTANRLAVEEFNFWLGDAFASGGSNGYDHKLYAITAKGGWECVKRHFRDLGTNVDTAPFTAVGIGDMAGDVFGNGLILSRNFKLIAAFNHKHIFLDPTPNPTQSFEERVRLFNLKGSQWSDYNSALISKGGGVFNRFEKELKLKPEVRAALGISKGVSETMTGDEVINAILKAPVDVLWNGGIGTYVKASYQAQSDAGDGANDAVRVSAPELRSRIIGEGGNLGFTQAARIEFNRLGGKLNTDAIDNSGGVDLSDHEVNLKILFSQMMRNGTLTVADRNKILKEMGNEVCELVLDHNRSQALFLSLAERRSARNMPYIARLLGELTKLGYVNRALDNLPEEDAIRERERSGMGMTRPELAVCLSTTKMWVKDVLLASDVLENALTDEFCLEYFPSAVVAKFKAQALQHPLRKNIVATQIANCLVDTVGITSLLKLSTRASRSFSDAIRAALNAELVLNTRATRTSLLRNEANLSGEEFLAIHQTLATNLGQVTAWFLARSKGVTGNQELFALRDACQRAFSGKSEVLPEAVAKAIAEQTRALLEKGLNQRDAQLLAWCPQFVSLIEVLWISSQNPEKTPLQASSAYFSLLQTSGCDLLIRALAKYSPVDSWEAELLPGLASDLRYALAAGTARALKTGSTDIVGAEQLGKTIEEGLRGTVRGSTLAVFTRQVVALLSR